MWLPDCHDGSDEVGWVTARWQADHALGHGTVTRMGAILDEFVNVLSAHGVPGLLNATRETTAAFVRNPTRRSTPPALHTLHLRRTTLRTAYRTVAAAGISVEDPTEGMRLPPKTRRVARPLDDDEMALVRVAAHTATADPARATAAIALAEATASTGEIALITKADVDVRTGTVQLPGIGRIRPRTGQITPWGLATLVPLLDEHSSDAVSLVHQAASPSRSHAAQALTVKKIRRVLDAAGLRAEPDVKPNSIRLWAGAAIAAAGGSIEDVATALGLRSFDAAAAAIGQKRPRR